MLIATTDLLLHCVSGVTLPTTVTTEPGLKMRSFLPFLEAGEQQGLTFKKLLHRCLVTARKAKQAQIYLNPVDGKPPGMHARLGFAEGEGGMYTQVKIKNLESK